MLSKHSTSATPPIQTCSVYLYFLSHPQLVHVGCRVVNCAGAVGSWRGVEQGGWVEQLRKAWWWVAGLEPAEIRSRQNKQPWNSVGGVFRNSEICACRVLFRTLGGLLMTGLSMWAMGSKMLKGTNPTWLKRFRHFHQRLDDSITCQTQETTLFT